MSKILEQYEATTGTHIIDHLKQLAEPLKGVKMLHINSTKSGGGVAEILHKLIPLKRELGIDASWEVIEGNPEFYQVTKSFHNGFQGTPVYVSDKQFDVYQKTNAENFEKLEHKLREADIVFIHDPQPAALLNYMGERKNKWIWRCHIDASKPHRPVWKFLRPFVTNYDASIFSIPQFARKLPHTVYLIPPSIDPLSDKNCELSEAEIKKVYTDFNLDPDKPMILQVSRFDRFKDPIGVIEAYKLAKRYIPLQLVLAGGTATDDPEGAQVLEEVQKAAGSDPDIHILLLPPDAHRTINALQRASDLVLQKSIKEGFGLTVSEAMWKRKPVIGGDTGGIRLQCINYYTGFLVKTPEGAALRIRYLLHKNDKRLEMGEMARNHIKENFLLTRHLREYLALSISTLKGQNNVIDLGLDWESNEKA